MKIKEKRKHFQIQEEEEKVTFKKLKVFDQLFDNKCHNLNEIK